jgi:hypothetical protein
MKRLIELVEEWGRENLLEANVPQLAPVKGEAPARDTTEKLPEMPDGVVLLQYTPLPPPVQLSRSEAVTDTGVFITSTLRQLDHEFNGRQWLAGNWGISGLIARLAATGCVVALDQLQNKGGSQGAKHD